MRITCPNASRYQALRPPKCGCLSCRMAWVEKQVADIAYYVKQRRDEEAEERRSYL